MCWVDVPGQFLVQGHCADQSTDYCANSPSASLADIARVGTLMGRWALSEGIVCCCTLLTRAHFAAPPAQVGYLFLPSAAVQQLLTQDPSSGTGVVQVLNKSTTSSACGGPQERDATDIHLKPLQQQKQEHVDAAQVEMLQAASSQRAHSDKAEAAGTSQHSDKTVGTQHGDSVHADNAAAGCTAAGSDIEKLTDDFVTAAALKKLEGVGLLIHYKALQRRLTSGTGHMQWA